MVKLKAKEIVNKVINCPAIAIHLILIRFANKTVFTVLNYISKLATFREFS